MPKKHRYFIIVSHCLLNPSTRVRLLGKGFALAQKIVSYLLDKKLVLSNCHALNSLLWDT